MFGSLFDDDKPTGMTYVHNLQLPVRPPPPRLSCGLSGIENQGATCYLNSLLQTLLYTPEFREGLFALSDSELGPLEDREKGGKVRIIPLQLQRLFARLLLVEQQAASTSELTDSFGWCNNEELQQHDVQELNRILFSAIERSLVGTSGSNLISGLYHGSTVTEIVCQNCGKISEREEDFLDLNVIVAGFNSLQDSLNATFLQKENMKGKNQYRCSTCCNLVDAKKGIKIRCLPPILTFSLLRFSYDLIKGERYKETGKFTFPFEIDMLSYCDKIMKPEDSIYELFSVVVHSGSSYGGHYHAYIRDVDCLGKWWPPEDEPFILPTLPDRKKAEPVQGPLAVIKSLLLMQEQHCLDVDSLCQEISKTTGMSWNKRYKGTYGPINKFLLKYDDVFFVNSATNIVYLKDNPAKTDNVDSTSDENNCHSPMSNSVENIPGSPKEVKKNSVKSSLKLNFFDKKRAQISSSVCGYNWFDFNDSCVCPVLIKEIEKQYSGKESAYMLFYRRKSLVRPEEAKENPCYMMPKKLTDLAEHENSELRQQREEYETALNTITLQIHLSDNYTFQDGALMLKPEVPTTIELLIDKRKTLLDLRESISKIYLPSPLVLHTAQELPSGLHLFDELGTSKNNMVLKDLSILEGTRIFVWDGLQVDQKEIEIGAECAPVLLNVSVVLPDGQTSEVSRGFSKAITVEELKAIVCDIIPVQLPLHELTVSRLVNQGDETKIIMFSDGEVKSKISELGLTDGETLVIESSIGENKPYCREITHTVPLFVQNQYAAVETEQLGESQFIELAVDPESTIADVKSLALCRLGLEDTTPCRLRKYVENQNKQPPLHEDQTVKMSGLTEVKYLILEEGEPPAADEVTVMFSVGTAIGEIPFFEITLNKTATVQHCLRKMLDHTGLEGEAWHLRKTNWCGEPMEKLTQETATLEEESIQHGDYLIIMEGRLLPKGYLSFSIWLYPTFESMQNPSQPTINGISSTYEGIYRSLYGTNDNVCNLIRLGEVELSNESTLADLKRCVMTLPLLSSLILPSLKFLRLRLLDGNRPAKVLRGQTNTLKKLRIPPNQSLCAQLLTKEEDLMQNDILLNISSRLPDTKSYAPQYELVWDTSKSAGVKSLKQLLSEISGIPIQRLVTAKHFPEKYQWLVIEENYQKKSNKNRWGTKKSNLRHSPFFLKDGDTIGVKDRSSDPDDLDDFNTQEDILGQKALKIAAEGKRQKRQEKNALQDSGMLGGSDAEMPRHAKKSEVGITIHVDDFR